MTGRLPGEDRAVAAFDFDGTLTARDTLVPFLARASSRRRVAGSLGRELPTLVRGASRVGARDEAKARLIARLFAGDDPARLHQLGDEYAELLLPRLRPAMVERVAWHREQGHALVMVSASLRYYLEPLAARLGFDHVIAVELEVGPHGRLTGRLEGPNVRGEEKATRLVAWLGREPDVLWAYGDSRGDAALLAMASHPVPVTRRARRYARAETPDIA